MKRIYPGESLKIVMKVRKSHKDEKINLLYSDIEATLHAPTEQVRLDVTKISEDSFMARASPAVTKNFKDGPLTLDITINYGEVVHKVQQVIALVSGQETNVSEYECVLIESKSEEKDLNTDSTSTLTLELKQGVGHSEDTTAENIQKIMEDSNDKVWTDDVQLSEDIIIENAVGKYKIRDVIERGTPLTHILQGIFSAGDIPPGGNHAIYIGYSDNPSFTPLTDSQIKALGHSIEDIAKGYSFQLDHTCKAFWICVPSSLGNITSAVGDISMDPFTQNYSPVLKKFIASGITNTEGNTPVDYNVLQYVGADVLRYIINIVI